MRRAHVLPLLLVAAAFGLAGCGGDDDDNGDSGSGGSNATPAQAILGDAGLQICGDAEDQILQSIGEDGVQNVVAYAVAKDCAGKKTAPDAIIVYQFSSIESRDAAAKTIAASSDRAIVMTSGALVVVSAGPNREANADAVGQAYTDSTGEPVTTV
jgi:hypothetical protein